MIDLDTIQNGGFRVISEEALPSLATAANPFPTLPSGCCGVLITLYTGDLTIRFDGQDATASSGQKLAITSVPIMLAMSYEALSVAKALGTATGWITYLGSR